jgi:hypothetical protein
VSDTDTKIIRHFGRVLLRLNGALLVRLEDGRRCSVSPNELDGDTFEPGQRIELSMICRGDGAWIGSDVAGV